jgi:hypothetical protein
MSKQGWSLFCCLDLTANYIQLLRIDAAHTSDEQKE